MFSRCLLTFAALVVPAGLFAQASDAYQIRYAANLNIGESDIDITNTGFAGGFSPGGDLCVNVYAFDPSEEMQSCCSCYTTPNGLYSLGVNRDLLSNTLTGRHPSAVVVKLTATHPVGGSCNAGSPGSFSSGIRAWGTTLHRTPSGGYSVTETGFASAGPTSASELSKLATQCSFIQVVGSGSGQCSSCTTGGLARVNR